MLKHNHPYISMKTVRKIKRRLTLYAENKHKTHIADI